MMSTMMRTLGRAALMAGLLALVTTSAEAQRRGLVKVPQGDRGGFWASIGGAVGFESLDLQGDLDGNGQPLGYSDRLAKPVIQAKLGGTVNQNLRLGVEIFSWLNSNNGLSERTGHFAGIAQVYPARAAGFFFKGAAGVAFSTVQLDAFASTTDLGFSYGGGVGYEVRVGRNLYLVPTADFYQTSNSSGPQASFRERFLNLGVNVQFQSGRRL